MDTNTVDIEITVTEACPGLLGDAHGTIFRGGQADFCEAVLEHQRIASVHSKH